MKPDVWPPRFAQPPSKGYAPILTTRRVLEAQSTCFKHHLGSHDETHLWADGPMALYSTRLLALQVLRKAVCDDTMRALESIDRQITQELVK